MGGLLATGAVGNDNRIPGELEGTSCAPMKRIAIGDAERAGLISLLSSNGGGGTTGDVPSWSIKPVLR